MLKIDPKLAADEIPVSWNAYALLQSYVGIQCSIQSCTVTIEVAPWSKLQDPNVSQMLDGAPVTNAVPVKVGLQTFPAGSIVTQNIKGGVVGASYIATFTPVFTIQNISESEQIAFDVVEYLPPEITPC